MIEQFFYFLGVLEMQLGDFSETVIAVFAGKVQRGKIRLFTAAFMQFMP